LLKGEKKLYLKIHPNKGGDPEVFKATREFFDELRRIKEETTSDKQLEETLQEAIGNTTSLLKNGNVVNNSANVIRGIFNTGTATNTNAAAPANNTPSPRDLFGNITNNNFEKNAPAPANAPVNDNTPSPRDLFGNITNNNFEKNAPANAPANANTPNDNDMRRMFNTGNENKRSVTPLQTNVNLTVKSKKNPKNPDVPKTLAQMKAERNRRSRAGQKSFGTQKRGKQRGGKRTRKNKKSE
jgi:hypothetical protein